MSTRTDVLPRFHTRGGATVTLTGDDRDGYGWDDTENGYGNKTDAVDDANQHASECWSIPKPGDIR